MSADPGSRPEAKSSTFGESFDRVFSEELDCLRERWRAVYPDEEERAERGDPRPKPTTENELVGLAFSGGGIRSATINMGIAQALHRRGVFDHVDYMSTVSGGGYLGSSISTAMRELPEPKPDEPEPPRHKGEFPYAYKEPATSDDPPPPGEQPEVETKFLTWVRNNSNYMATGEFLDWPRIIGVLLRGILANFLVLLPFLLVFAVVMAWGHGGTLAQWERDDQAVAAKRIAAEKAAEEAERTQVWATGGDPDAWSEAESARLAAEQVAKEAEKLAESAAKTRAGTEVFLWVMVFAGLFLLLVFVFPVLIRVYKAYRHEGALETGEESSVHSRGTVEKVFGFALVLIFVAAALEALPLLIRWFHKMETTGLRGIVAGAGSGGALAVFTVAGRLLSSLGGLKQKIVLLLVGLLGLAIPLAVGLFVVDDLVYPVAGIEAAPESALEKALAERPQPPELPEPRVDAEGRQIPVPAYRVMNWGHEPLRFGAVPSLDDVVRLLPGVLLLIMFGGLFAAAAGKLHPGKLRACLALVLVLIGAFVGYCIVIFSSWSLAQMCAELGFSTVVGGVSVAAIRPDVLILAMTLVVIVYCWAAVDVNLTGMLGLYRDRLASAYLIGVRKKGKWETKGGKRTFIPEVDEKGEPTNAEEVFVEPDLNLEDLCGGEPPAPPKEPKDDAQRAKWAEEKAKWEEKWGGKVTRSRFKAPYHIVNTALNLQGSDDPMLRDRGSDFFMFSKLYYGGHRTGYCPTRLLEKVFPQMDLPTAMAISAAAASPNSGRMTSKPLVALMTLLNVRLGYWVPHPGRLFKWLSRRIVTHPEVITHPKVIDRWRWRIPARALLLEMAGRVNERDKWVNLSDGGHIENMAVYELLRRRCKYIICGDGEADPGLTFGGLATLMRSARIDMGIEIEILLDDVRLDKEGKSHQHAALGKIVYPSEHRQERADEPGECPVCGGSLQDCFEGPDQKAPADGGPRYRCPRGELEIGHLLYIKSSFTANEDETMQQYRANNPDFPHETTADQFFDEGQFEAYRALGFHMADTLFPAVEPGEDPRTHGDWNRFTTWFGRLRSDLAPRLSAKHEALQDQLRRIAKLLQREEFEDYFYELNPRLGRLEKRKEGPRKKASMQQIYYLVGLQLDLMESAFLGLNLDQPINWNHPGNQGWRKMFKDWSRSESFQIAYSFLSHLHSGRFQNFCRRSLKLVPAGERSDPKPGAQADAAPA